MLCLFHRGNGEENENFMQKNDHLLVALRSLFDDYLNGFHSFSSICKNQQSFKKYGYLIGTKIQLTTIIFF